MAAPGTGRGLHRPLLAVAFVAFWVIGTVVAISASGERGADSEDALFDRAATALRDGDPSAFGEVLLDGADHDFADDYVTRLRAAGTPEVARTGPDTAEIRSGAVSVTVSVAEQRGRWYLSLLPPG